MNMSVEKMIFVRAVLGVRPRKIQHSWLNVGVENAYDMSYSFEQMLHKDKSERYDDPASQR